MPQPARTLTVDGVTRPIGEWAALTGVPVETIRARLARGWADADAARTPSDRRFRAAPRTPVDAPKPCPRLQRHPTGQAYARWREKGERHHRYFGPWGTDEARRAYDRFAVEWATGQARREPVRPGQCVTVAGLVARWLAHCSTWYVKHGKRTSEVHAHRSAAGRVARLFADLPAAEFTPARLRQVRQAWVDDGLARSTVNGYQSRVVHMFAWGVPEGLVPPAVREALAQVEYYDRGRFPRPDRKRRTAAPWADVRKTLPHLHPRRDRRRVLQRMVLFQWWAGCRPQDVAGLRACDLDRSGDVWRWEPHTNKNEHRDKPLVYWLGPRAQRVLAPLLAAAPPDRPLFCYPPLTEGGTRFRPVTRLEYGRRVKAACAAAKVTPWTPHQLRHARATAVAGRYDVDAAAAAIGDTAKVAAAVYVHIDPLDAVRAKIARETG